MWLVPHSKACTAIPRQCFARVTHGSKCAATEPAVLRAGKHLVEALLKLSNQSAALRILGVAFNLAAPQFAAVCSSGPQASIHIGKQDHDKQEMFLHEKCLRGKKVAVAQALGGAPAMHSCSRSSSCSISPR